MYRYVGNEPTGFNDPFGLFFGFGGLGRAGGGSGSGNGSCGRRGDENWWDLLEQGYYYGTGYGDEAVEWWADKYNQSSGLSAVYYGFGGVVATWWTPDMWMETSSILVGAYVIRVIGPFSTRGLPKYSQRIRRFIRFDSPHHGKGWRFDGEWVNYLRRLNK